jgi:hypothetical protein
MTLNEIRRAEDLPDVPDGDLILNPTYTTAQQQRKQMAMQEKQAAAAAAVPPATPPATGGGGEPGEEAQGGEEGSEEEGSKYADNFSKSIKVLEISLDDDSWIDMYRGSRNQ